jgi:hypothetical protein
MPFMVEGRASRLSIGQDARLSMHQGGLRTIIVVAHDVFVACSPFLNVEKYCGDQMFIVFLRFVEKIERKIVAPRLQGCGRSDVHRA